MIMGFIFSQLGRFWLKEGLDQNFTPGRWFRWEGEKGLEEEMRLEMLFKFDAVTILPIPCVKHVLRIVFICMWQLSDSQISVYIRIFQETCLKWAFLGFSAKYPGAQLISQVILTEVLRNLYDRNKRFLDLIFRYTYLESSAVQVQW